jgi:hypothetical protein
MMRLLEGFDQVTYSPVSPSGTPPDWKGGKEKGALILWLRIS